MLLPGHLRRFATIQRHGRIPIAVISMMLVGTLGAPCYTLAADVNFLREIAPILLQRCAGCHGPAKREGDFRLHTFESLLKRNALSDPQQLVPLLKDISSDERLPLITRNHALRLIAQIDKHN